MTVSSIIVTYNRKAELLRCIEAVLSQTIKPDNLLIVNNASTDGTENAVYQMFGAFVPMQQVDHDVVFKSVNSGITPVYLINKKSNSGGSGGFYIGLKAAHECFKTDCYWMMDDDGYPSIKCLERQLIYIERYDYVMPISIDIDNHDKLSWATKKRNGKKTISYLELKNDFGEIMPFIFPFNGSLLSLNLIKKVGYIKPELFIWGDDYEHYYRCLKAGFKPVTLLDAIFYHPSNKVQTYPIMKGLFRIPYTESRLRLVCLVRNWAYIYKKNRLYYHLIRSFLAYSWLFMFTLKDWTTYGLYLASFYDGLTENWERHKKYI